MLFHSAESTNVDPWLNDGAYVLQQKFDGTRATVVITLGRDLGDSTVDYLARTGAPLKHTASTQWFDKISTALVSYLPHLYPAGHEAGSQIVLDGELMHDTGTLVLFDLIETPNEEGAPVIGPGDIYRDRLLALEALWGPSGWGPGQGRTRGVVWVTGTAYTPMQKASLFQAVVDNVGEGVMVKSLDAAYEPGRRVRHSQKIKFYRTADVVVMDWHRGNDGKDKHGNPTGRETGNIHFGLWDDLLGEFVPLGRCSIIGKPHVEKGWVIEVKYLSRMKDGGLVQPTMLRVREDREPTSCTTDQFQVYSKSIV